MGDRWPVLGCGVGLRTEHYETIMTEWPRMDWFEAISENFMDSGGHPLRVLEAVRHVAERVEQVQTFLRRRILLENVSSYVTYRHSTMSEWEFITAVAERSGCGMLLDLNNVYVNAYNHQFDPLAYLDHIPGELIGQYHLAGHTNFGTYLFDTHSAPVIEEVWALYRAALAQWRPVTTLIEWDEDIPPFARLADEAQSARAIYVQVCGGQPVSEPLTS